MSPVVVICDGVVVVVVAFVNAFACHVVSGKVVVASADVEATSVVSNAVSVAVEVEVEEEEDDVLLVVMDDDVVTGAGLLLLVLVT